MRELKFRAWDGENLVSPDYISRDGRAWWKENSIPTSSNIVEQFTGLHDNNGKEIYEGDIVNGSYGIPPVGIKSLVEYEGTSFIIKTNGHFPEQVTVLEAIDCLDIIVIGNIHENPELLEDK